MKYEWYPWNPSRFRADTMHLTAEQRGIYRDLIDHYMETELPLPDNDVALARIGGVSPECFKQSASMLRAFFKQKDGKLFHKKCDEVLEEMNARYFKRREKASKGGKAKAAKAIEKKGVPASSTPQAERKQCLNVLSNLTLPNPKGLKERKINKKKIQVSEKFAQFWKDYPKHRKGNQSGAWTAWQRALEEGRATEDEILLGARSYAKSEKGQGEFAKGAAAWINDDRWNWEVSLETIKYQKNEWPEWKIDLAKVIGERNVASWFNDAQINGAAIYVPKQFTAENIRTRFLADIEKTFGKPYQIVVKTLESVPQDLK